MGARNVLRLRGARCRSCRCSKEALRGFERKYIRQMQTRGRSWGSEKGVRKSGGRGTVGELDSPQVNQK